MERTIPSFKVKEVPEDELYERWTEWRRMLEHWLNANDIADEKKLDNLMVFGGLELQKVLYALVSITKKKKPTYSKAIKELNAFFKPKHHAVFTRHKFWSIRREPEESIDNLIMKIRDKANSCDFGSPVGREYAMYDKLVMLMPRDIKEKLLQKNQTFSEAVQMIKAHESTKSQVQQMETMNNANKFVPSVNYVQRRPDAKFECHRCGSKDHAATYEKCPAWNAVCRKCGGKNHFARVCKSESREGKRTFSERKRDEPDKKNQKYSHYEPDRKKRKYSHINNVNERDVDETTICNINPAGVKVVCQVGKLNVRFLVDTGTSKNVIDENTWKIMVANGYMPKKKIKDCMTRFTGYGNTSLNLICAFTDDISMRNSQGTSENETFYVIEHGAHPLLSKGSVFINFLCLSSIK